MDHLGNISWALFCGRRRRRRWGQTRVHLISHSPAPPLPSVNHAPPYIAFRSVFDAQKWSAEQTSLAASPRQDNMLLLPQWLLIFCRCLARGSSENEGKSSLLLLRRLIAVSLLLEIRPGFCPLLSFLICCISLFTAPISQRKVVAIAE